MAPQKSFIFFVGILLILSSCVVQEKLINVQIEVLIPGRFNIPISNSTIVIYNRTEKRNDSILIFNPGAKDKLFPYLLKNRNIISSMCSEYLAKNLKNYYQLNNFKFPNGVITYESTQNRKTSIEKFFTKTKSDVVIFIDSVNVFTKEEGASNYKYKKPMAYIDWSIAWKNDSAYSVFKQDTILRLSDEVITSNSGRTVYDARYLNDVCNKLAVCVAEQISPNWKIVDRSYYHSKNLTMLKAEEFAQKSKWLQAAEIWKTKTEIKKRRLAAKACFNMAMASEMEGKSELALDWVKKATEIGHKYDEEHQNLCKQYSDILKLKIKESDLLKMQMGY